MAGEERDGEIFDARERRSNMNFGTCWKVWKWGGLLGICLVAAACIAPPPVTETPIVLPGTPTQQYPYPIPATPERSIQPPYPPPLEIAKPGQLPEIPNDLVFLDRNRLVLWRHQSNTLDVLDGVDSNKFQAGYVLFYSVHAESRNVIFVRAERTKYALILMNMDTKEKRLLRETIHVPVYPSISPDGQWVVFLQTRLRTWQRCRNELILRDHNTSFPAVCHGTVMAIHLADPQTEVIVGKCESVFYKPEAVGCLNILWEKEGGKLIWSDGFGIWKGSVRGRSRLLISTNSLTDEGTRELEAIFRLSAISPSGRYLLLEKMSFEGFSWSVVDLETGSVHDFPENYIHTFPRAIWLADERIFYLRTLSKDHSPPEGQLWKVFSDGTSSLQMESAFALPVNAEGIAAYPFQLDENQLTFAITNLENYNYQERGLFTVGLPGFQLHRLNGVPPLHSLDEGKYMEFSWTFDGSGLLYLDRPLDMFYIPTQAPYLISLGSITNNPCCFTWIAP